MKKIASRTGAKLSMRSPGKSQLVERGAAVVARLRQIIPAPKMALIHRNEFELLVATILSAQCTDERVNKTTPALFAAAPTPSEMVELGVESIRELIKSINFFRNKSQNLWACAQRLRDVHGGRVPQTLEELILLPGVGRKTANVVLGNAFGVPGMVVDTHVQRLANRLGFARGTDAVKTEAALEKIFPSSEWVDLAHLLILHGRATCTARRPACERCILVDLCPSAFRPSDDWLRRARPAAKRRP